MQTENQCLCPEQRGLRRRGTLLLSLSLLVYPALLTAACRLAIRQFINVTFMCAAHRGEPVLFCDKDYICQALSAHAWARQRIILPRIALPFPLTRGRLLVPPSRASRGVFCQRRERVGRDPWLMTQYWKKDGSTLSCFLLEGTCPKNSGNLCDLLRN